MLKNAKNETGLRSRGKRCPINFCHFYDPPKPGVKRAKSDYFGSKIAKKSLKMPKIRLYVSPKIGENPLKTRVGRAEYEFCELKIAKKFQKHTPKLMF